MITLERGSHIAITNRRIRPIMKYSLIFLSGALLFCSRYALAQTNVGSNSIDLSSPQVVAAGEKTFAASCSVGYCHGKAGRAGRGPRLRGKTWEKQYLYDVILNGIPSSSMPAWKDRLAEKEIWEVVAYVMTLSKLTSDSADSPDLAAVATPAKAPESRERPSPAQPAQPSVGPVGDPERGKSLFFDSSNDFNCGGCHKVRGVGNGVGPDLTQVQQRQARELFRDIVLPSYAIAPGRELLKITTQTGERIDALKVDEDDSQIKVYDVGSLPPVLRTISKAQVQKLETEKRSGMPDKYGEIYTLKQLLDLISFLKSGDASVASSVRLQDLF
jgi:putative heme-binding domain-containing protein